ncbi:MAG TPA: T9SS type A sorting domain-containing protein, partial [candidate division Zixibacteria bacterium]|nr:T9SS type A sorting domain-containing protein [candidate division Zixibacteria bacterium]
LEGIDGVAADKTTNVVYLSRLGPIDDGLWVSFDGGNTWVHHPGYIQSVPYSGNREGEVLLGVAVFSFDYGATVAIGAGYGLPTPLNVYSFGGGCEPGESYFIDFDGDLYRGWAYADSFAYVSSVGVCMMTAGTTPGEVWLLRRDTLFYSADHGSTFTEMGIIPIGFTDFIRGSHSGSLFICHIEVNESCMTGIRGGTIEICYTENFGSSYVCITHNGEGRTIEEISGIWGNWTKPESVGIDIYPNPFNSSCIISVPAGAGMEIYNLQGRLVYAFPGISKGPEKYIWHPDRSIPAGVYLVRAITRDGQTAEKKILLLK